MTTRRQRRRVSTQELTRLITRVLREDRDTSTRAIIAKIREQGVSAGNDRARALIRIARAVGDNITAEIVAGRSSIFATDSQFITALRAVGGNVADRYTGLYVQIAFTARATVPYVLHGKADTITVAVGGTRAFPVPFNAALLKEVATRMLGGAAMERLGDLPTDGPVMGEYGHFDADIEIHSVTLV